MRARYYQEDAINAVFNYFINNSGNPIVAAPPGVGKSYIIAELIHRVFLNYPNQRVIMLTHVKELIDQNFKTLLKVWPTAPAGIYSAGLGRKDAHCSITYAGIGSICKKSSLFGHIDLILVDECHLISPRDETMYGTFIRALKQVNPALKIIGLTATPYRLGLGMLTDGGLFTDICYDCTKRESFNRLVVEGYLSPLVVKRTVTTLDTEDVGIRGGEFIQGELQEAVDIESITKAAVNEIIEAGQTRNCWLIFATGIQHTEHITEYLVSQGIPAAAVHSKMSSTARDNIISDLKKGALRAVVNNNVLTTGFDHPAIDLIGVLRPTTSTVLWTQILGRGLRPCEGKQDCLVMDFAGNSERLGPVNDPVVPKIKGKKRGLAPIRCCEECDTFCHASLRICPECGAAFPEKVKITSFSSDIEVMRLGGKPPAPPKVLEHIVDSVLYSQYDKLDRPPSILVTYYCGMRMFKHWICVEHSGLAGSLAKKWWFIQFGTALPATTKECLEILAIVPAPKKISVRYNGKYPEVLF